MSSYLIDHFKGVYRLKPSLDIYNQFPKKLNGTNEDIDIYIDCQRGVKIFYYGRGLLEAYVPSVMRGKSIIKKIEESTKVPISNIQITDAEVMFRFKSSDMTALETILKPKTNGKCVSPFSKKNIPRSKVNIPDEDLLAYKKIIENSAEKAALNIGYLTTSFIKNMSNKKEPLENIKMDMSRRGIFGKEYIYVRGRWSEFLDYLKTNLGGCD